MQQMQADHKEELEKVTAKITEYQDAAEEYRAARDKGRLFAAVFQCQLEVV